MRDYAHSVGYLYGHWRLESGGFDMIVEAGYTDEDICSRERRTQAGGLPGPLCFPFLIYKMRRRKKEKGKPEREYSFLCICNKILILIEDENVPLMNSFTDSQLKNTIPEWINLFSVIVQWIAKGYTERVT